MANWRVCWWSSRDGWGFWGGSSSCVVGLGWSFQGCVRVSFATQGGGEVASQAVNNVVLSGIINRIE